MPDLTKFKVNSPALMASMILISGGCFHKGNKVTIMSFFLFATPITSTLNAKRHIYYCYIQVCQVIGHKCAITNAYSFEKNIINIKKNNKSNYSNSVGSSKCLYSLLMSYFNYEICPKGLTSKLTHKFLLRAIS